MKRILGPSIVTVLCAGMLAASAWGDSTAITAALNAPVIGASGGSQIYWGPIVTQTTLGMSGNTNTNYPQKFAGSSISGSGGAAGSRQYCVNPGDPTSGPGTIVPPSAVPVYEWFCDVNPVPAAPQVDFTYYKFLAQQQGNACGGQSCYNADASPSFSGIYDPVCTVNGHPKVWFFEGDVSFSGGTYFCGVLLSRAGVSFTGGGAGQITMTPPAAAWQQYQVATPNGTAGFGDTAAQDEYPGDGGLNVVKNYSFSAGGGGFNGDPVSFQGYVYATTGYTAGGHTLVVGAVQFGQGAASTAGGGTIFYVPQIIYTVPPNSAVAQPIITPAGGTFTGSVSVTIADTTPGAEIHYTLDGTVPDQTSTLYTGALTLTADTTVKAIGTRSDLNPSSVATADFTLLAGPVNLTPVVNAGTDQSFNLPSSANLTGSATDDGLPNPPAALVYAWNKISGPGIVTFGDPSDPITTAGFSQAGTYVLRLAAFDGQLSGTDDIQIIVQPVPPPAVQFSAGAYSVAENAGFANITVTRTGANLTGTSTVDFVTTDGPNTLAGQNYVRVSGALVFTAGEAGKSFQVPVINDGLASGNKTVVLMLSNPTGATLGTPNPATLTITDAGSATPAPPNPFISALVPYAAPVNYGSPFTMRVLGSGFDASNAQVIWNNGGTLAVVSRSATEIDVTVTPGLWNNTVGSYTVMVRNPGNVDSNTVPFTVLPTGGGNSVVPPFVVQEPLANPNPTYGRTTQLTVLGGTFSSGGETVLTYDWQPVGLQPNGFTFSANNSHAASNMTATFNGPGVYRFQVTITDALTKLSVVTKTLEVTVILKATSLTLTPKTQAITLDQTVTLTAVVKDQFGGIMNPALGWTSSGGSLAPSNTTAILSPDTATRMIRITAATLDNSLMDDAVVYVMYGAGGVGDLSEAVPAPVPYKSSSGLPGVTFKRLNPGTKIRIFSTDGRHVQTLISNDGSDVLWDLKNSAGSRTSSGVYMYIMEGSGQQKKGKLVLIL